MIQRNADQVLWDGQESIYEAMQRMTPEVQRGFGRLTIAESLRIQGKLGEARDAYLKALEMFPEGIDPYHRKIQGEITKIDEEIGTETLSA